MKDHIMYRGHARILAGDLSAFNKSKQSSLRG